MNFLLDANVLSDIGNKKPWAGRLRSKISLYGAHRCFLSAIAYTEMLSGLATESGRLSKAKREDLAVIYESLVVLPYGVEAARETVALRAAAQGKPLPKLDSMIAGHAVAAGLMLVTADSKDYGRMPGLSWNDWRPAT